MDYFFLDESYPSVPRPYPWTSETTPDCRLQLPILPSGAIGGKYVW